MIGAGECLRERRKQGKKAFIPFLTAGDPNLASTEKYIAALVSAGADIIEIGVPFSDPMADGPVNQRSAARALRAGVSLSLVLDLCDRLTRGGVTTPLVIFTYYNPILRMGIETFAKRARASGVGAVLALDLPPEEATRYCQVLGQEKVETVFLASPTTDPKRLPRIDAASTGFVYYVSRTGVTGVQAELSDTLGAELSRIRPLIRNPIAVGFGISAPEQARAVAKFADAVVVGSAIVEKIEAGADFRALGEFAAQLAAAVHGENRRGEKC